MPVYFVYICIDTLIHMFIIFFLYDLDCLSLSSIYMRRTN